MSVQTYTNPNQGPLKLEHDSTPRDFTSDRPVDPKSKERDFRYQGFPGGNFFSPRQRPILPEDGIVSPGLQENHALKRYFDTNRPKDFGNPQGLQYGSDSIPTSRAGPRPMRDPFHDKTSADLRRFHQEVDEAEVDIKKYKEEQAMRLRQKENEKKKDLDMLKSYDPWGRPGAGAPNKSDQGASFDNKKQRFTEYDTDRKPNLTPRDVEYSQEFGDFHASFGRPGAGAPLRTNSGNVKAELKGDMDIRFLDTTKGREVYNKEIRYKSKNHDHIDYSKDLDNQIKVRAMNNQEQRIQDLKKELETIKHDPYGKPGAGAPNKSKSEHARNSLRSSQSEFDYYDPWGKGAGQPRRDKYGEVERHNNSEKTRGIFTMSPKRTEENSENSLPLDSSRGGAGAPLKSESGTVKTRMAITMKRGDYGDTSIKEEMPGKTYRSMDDPDLQVYDPFGKGGGGAPLRDPNGNIVTNIYGKMRNDKFNGHRINYQNTLGSKTSADQRKRLNASQNYLAELQRDMEVHKENRVHQDMMLKSGGGELAAIIRHGQVGRPRRDPHTGMLANQHLGSTDVTKEATNTKSMKSENSPLYHTELERAADERKRVNELDKLKDKQETKHHQSAMNDFWGKPGAGAPNPAGAKMANLDNILYSPRREPNDFYNKRVEETHPYNYVRSTVNSKATNLYEFDVPTKREPKKNYQLNSPWAIEQGESF